MRRVILQALLLLFGSSALGLLVNTISPRGIPYLRPPQPPVTPDEVVSLTDAEALWSTGAALFLDARPAEDYAAGHIAGAFNLSSQDFDQRYPAVAPLLAPDQQLIVYCDGELCDLSHNLARRLRELGWPDVRILFNGWTVWRQAGLPTRTGSEP